MQVRFTSVARQELKRLFDIYGEYSGPLSVKKFGQLVDNKIKELQKFPYTGFPEPLLADFKFTFRAKPINKNYKMIYLVEEDTLWIYDFWDMRRNPESLRRRINTY